MEAPRVPIISDNNDLGNVAIDATGCLPVSDRDPSKLEKDSVPYDLNFSIMCLLRNHNSEPVDKAGLSMCADVNPDDDHGFSEDKGPRNFNFSNGSSNLHSTSTLVKPTPIRPTGGFCTALLCPQLLPYEEPTQERLFQKAIPDGSSTKIITSQLQNNLQISQQPFKQTLSQFETGTSNCVQSTNSGKRKRSWSRAVFSNLQRKGLEIQFQIQKYITKPDRRKLAATLNLTDAQVKVWFQNRRMKWRHARGNFRNKQEKSAYGKQFYEEESSDENEIDVVAD